MQITSQTGLTLIELMVSLAVATVLLTVAVPGYQQLRANNRLAADANALVTALKSARAEAIGRGRDVALCAKASSAADEQDCGGSDDWTNGWILFTDFSGAAGSRDGSDQVLRSWGGLDGAASLSTSAAAVRYQASGEIDTAALSFELTQTRPTGITPRCIRVNAVGQVRTATGACS